MKTITIATRGSRLALWQAHHVRDLIHEALPETKVELLVIKTKGDKILDVPLAKVGGKGLFVKEIEIAILEGKADLAVHSMKDVPADLEEGLHLSAISKREDPSDAWVSPQGGFEHIHKGARVGTSSLRRACQLRHRRPDLSILDLRGNVPTRLDKLDRGDYDAIVLASAGLKRLGFGDRISERFEPDVMLPAVGQGALAIETRIGDAPINDLMKRVVHHKSDAQRVRAERAFLLRLDGGCQAPMAAYARIVGDELILDGLVGWIDGHELLQYQGRCLLSEIEEEGDSRAERLGALVAEALLELGAGEIIKELMAQSAE